MEQNKIQLCDYGCGQEAQHQFKNGKWCCSKSFNACPTSCKKHSARIKEIHKDPNSKYNSKLYKENRINIIKEMWKDPDSVFNSDFYRKNQSIKMKELWQNPNSDINSISCKEKQVNGIKEAWQDPNSKYYSNSYRKRLTIKNINKKYPFFSKIEKMRYNPDKPEEKEIQVHCKNHKCENSKEKNGWFTPTYIQLYERIRNLEKDYGSGGTYLYCSQQCKDTCELYNVHSDPYRDTNLPYTPAEKEVWRQIVLKEDKGLCQYCGKLATDVHHIKPVKTHPHLSLDPDNGISFCKECHYKIGHPKGTECSTGNLANKQQQGCVLGSRI
jgi:5-methylcytosine-specific restriction endonuclease McrA